MKNKKGFTLIELLAVIVILAIIALIATPIILNMINDARKNAAKSSALGYIDAIEYNNGFAQLGTTDINGTYEEIKTGDVTTANQKLGSHLKGKAPTSGTVTIDTKGKVTAADFCINGYNVTYDGKDATVNGKCNGSNNNNNEPQQPSVPEPVSFATDSWATIATNTSSPAYVVGDEKEIQMDVDGDNIKEPYHIKIVNMTQCTTETSQTACGMVLQFKEPLKITNEDDKKMNLTATSSGGWPASKMRAYLNDGTNSIYNKLKAEIGDIIIDTTVVSGHESGVSSNYTSTDKLYLLAAKELGTEAQDTERSATRKLDYYSDSNSRKKYEYGTDTAINWWTRSTNSTVVPKNFYAINFYGNIGDFEANYAHGVAPTFRIRNTEQRKVSVFKSGPEVNIMMKNLAGTTTSSESTEDSHITAFKRSNTEPTSGNKTSNNIASSSSSDYPIYMWYSNGTIYWWSESNNIYLNRDASYMFNNMLNLNDISGLEYVNTKYTTSLFSTFWKCKSLSNITPIRNWNTLNVTTMRSTFHTTNLSNLDALSNWNTSNVTSMYRTFNDDDNSLEDASGINKWDISKVTDFTNMFGIYSSSPTIINPVHPTFKDSNNNPIPGTWNSEGTFIKSN